MFSKTKPYSLTKGSQTLFSNAVDLNQNVVNVGSKCSVKSVNSKHVSPYQSKSKWKTLEKKIHENSIAFNFNKSVQFGKKKC